ncbi:interleukin-13 receptor subunit alpha-2-like [Arapaima gigas]
MEKIRRIPEPELLPSLMGVTGRMQCETQWKLMVSLLEFCCCLVLVNTVTVDPPAELKILDPGYLGHLYINWTLPASLQNLNNCSVRFQLEYFDTYENRWRVVRTREQSYSAHFSLEKDACVHVETLVSGSCVNSSGELHSASAEAVLPARLGGLHGSKIDHLQCVFHNGEFMDCIWTKNNIKPLRCCYHLYYWHRGMPQAQECPEYLESHGERIGCRLYQPALLQFAEFNICVNGSASGLPLQAAYFSLQVQNQVKPAAVKALRAEATEDSQFLLEWMLPEGGIPQICLEFEVESVLGGTEGPKERNMTRLQSFVVSRPRLCTSVCLRVRSRVHKFCADRSFWSEWSHTICLPVGATGSLDHCGGGVSRSSGGAKRRSEFTTVRGNERRRGFVSRLRFLRRWVTENFFTPRCCFALAAEEAEDARRGRR